MATPDDPVLREALASRGAHSPRTTPSDALWRTVIVLGVVVALLATAVIGGAIAMGRMDRTIDDLELTVSTLQDDVLGNRAEVHEGRAVDCRLLLLVGGEVKEGGPCTDPETLRHYDPQEESRLGNGMYENRILMCQILRELDEGFVHQWEAENGRPCATRVPPTAP
jgi:hypothetical protein